MALGEFSIDAISPFCCVSPNVTICFSLSTSWVLAGMADFPAKEGCSLCSPAFSAPAPSSISAFSAPTLKARFARASVTPSLKFPIPFAAQDLPSSLVLHQARTEFSILPNSPVGLSPSRTCASSIKYASLSDWMIACSWAADGVFPLRTCPSRQIFKLALTRCWAESARSSPAFSARSNCR